MFLRQNPWCERPGCYDAATDVDHDKPIGTPGVDPWDWTNWRPLCHRHHSSKTATENRRRPR